MKHFIKNNFKAIITVIISGIIFTGIDVFAASTFYSSDVFFTSQEKGFTVDNV